MAPYESRTQTTWANRAYESPQIFTVYCVSAPLWIPPTIPTGGTARTLTLFQITMRSVYLRIMWARTAVQVPLFILKENDYILNRTEKKLCSLDNTTHWFFQKSVFIINGLPSYSLCCVNWIKARGIAFFKFFTLFKLVCVYVS